MCDCSERRAIKSNKAEYLDFIARINFAIAPINAASDKINLELIKWFKRRPLR